MKKYEENMKKLWRNMCFLSWTLLTYFMPPLNFLLSLPVSSPSSSKFLRHLAYSLQLPFLLPRSSPLVFGGRPAFPFGTGGHPRNCVSIHIRFPLTLLQEGPEFFKVLRPIFRNISFIFLHISSYFLHIPSYFFIFPSYFVIFPPYFFIFSEALEL